MCFNSEETVETSFDLTSPFPTVSDLKHKTEIQTKSPWITLMCRHEKITLVMVFVDTLKHIFQNCLNCSVVHLVLHLHLQPQGAVLSILRPVDSSL